jgi:hypothetical protein
MDAKSELPSNSDTGMWEEAMAAATSLKAVKKELRSLMRQKLSAISKETLSAQSTNCQTFPAGDC